MNNSEMSSQNKELLFAKKLEEIKALAKDQGQCVSKEQVDELFGELSLSEEQFALIYDYLKKHNVGIGEPADPSDYLEGEEVDYLNMYLEELKLLPEVSEGEKEAITLSAMAGDMDAQNKLTEVFLPEVVEIAKLYAGQGVFLEDLIGEGNVALAVGVTMLGAMENAKEAQGMLAKMIMDAMEEIIKETADLKNSDTKVADKINKVADKAAELAEELGREVTVEELIQETGMSKKAVLDAMRLSSNKIENLVKGDENV